MNIQIIERVEKCTAKTVTPSIHLRDAPIRKERSRKMRKRAPNKSSYNKIRRLFDEGYNLAKDELRQKIKDL